jgi:hypothetical protein
VFNWTIIDVAISLSAVYVAFSLLASYVQERIAAWFHVRADQLSVGLEKILGDPTLRDQLYAHPAIDAPTDPSGTRKPSYISAEQFTTAMVGLLTQGKAVVQGTQTALSDLEHQLSTLPDSRMKMQLMALWNQAGGEYTRFLQGLGNWYNDEMDRLSGWYRRYAVAWLFFIGLVLAIFFNVDTIQLVRSFAVAPLAIRAVSNPEDVAKQGFANAAVGWAFVPCTRVSTLGTSDQKASALRCIPNDKASIALKVLGLLLTAIAISLGAPFWFDLLKSFINVRNTGPKPADTTAK